MNATITDAVTRMIAHVWPIHRRRKRVTRADRDRGEQRRRHHRGDRLGRCGRSLPRVLHGGQVAEEAGQGEGDRDEVAEARAVEEVDRAEAEVRRHAEGADEVPGPIERLAPAECAAEELRAGADPIPEQADGPHQLVGLAATNPLVGDHRGEDEGEAGAQEWQDDVEIHGRSIAPSQVACARRPDGAGAHVRVRTGDLFLTKEVLCLLSYVGPLSRRLPRSTGGCSVAGSADPQQPSVNLRKSRARFRRSLTEPSATLRMGSVVGREGIEPPQSKDG